jgi:hypothetical protein
MFGFFTNPEKHTFTTRKGKKKQATLNQVLNMQSMWSDESIAKAERMAGGMNSNPIRLARTNPIRLAKTNPIRLARTNPGGKTMNARYGGKCKMTGEEYEPGAQITKVDGVGWCLAKNV